MMKSTLEALNWRYAVKKFSTRKIPDDQVNMIFEALRLTPSSLGLQAWKFINVEEKNTREKLLEASWYQRQVVDASHLLVFARPLEVSEESVIKWVDFLAKERQMAEDKKANFKKMIDGFLKSQNAEQLSHWLDKQLYIALGNLMTVCAVTGIDTCPMEGIKPEEYDRILNLPALGLTTTLVCPIGYRSEDDAYQNQPKVRFAQEDVFINI